MNYFSSARASLCLLLFAWASFQQVQAQSLDRNSAWLIALSEPEPLARPDSRADSRKSKAKTPAQPASTAVVDADELPWAGLARLATDLRLAGQWAEAADVYRRLTKESQDPRHQYFYQQCLKHTGQDMLLEQLTLNPEAFPSALPAQDNYQLKLGIDVRHARFGNLIPGVQVRLLDYGQQREFSQFSTDAGPIFFNHLSPDAELLIVIEKEGFEPQERSLRTGQALDIRLLVELDNSAFIRKTSASR